MSAGADRSRLGFLSRNWRTIFRSHSTPVWQAWWSFAAVYLALAGILIQAGNGLPYGTDNNESFSNLTHARAISLFGVTQSLGLTDETAATHVGASPYIHSHQGNFPRLFATVIYWLGARSVESQIWVTTIVIGLSAFWLAFSYLTRVANPIFAWIACLVMSTDYLLVMQWQVNTYRVWHAWFFFAVLWWLEGWTKSGSRRFALTGWLLFTALFYWEYVFGFFLGTLAAVYLIVAHPRVIGRWVQAWAIIIIGSVTAAGTLLLQLSFYMGWDNVVRDIQYTLTARNSAASQALTERVTAFYDRLHVLFWPNYQDATPLRTFARFRDSVLYDHLQYYTSPMMWLMLVLGGGFLIGLLRSKSSIAFVSWPRLILVSLFFTLIAVPGRGWLFDSGPFTSLWQQSAVTRGALIAVTGLAAWIGIRGISATLGENERGQMRRLVPLLVATLLAYGPTYWIFSGYVFSGYLYRQAPLLGFTSDIFLAIAFYCSVMIGARGLFRSRNELHVGARQKFSRAAYFFRYVWGGLACGVTLWAAWSWISLQFRYTQLLPLDSHTYLQRLTEPPFQGHSFVVNTYASPVSVQTGSWAMMEPALFTGHLTLTSHGYITPREDTYKWFADRATNPAYLKPDFALAERPSAFSGSLLLHSGSPPDGATPFLLQELGLVRRASRKFTAFLHPTIAALDITPRQSFAIVALDWNYPPFLAALAREDSPLFKNGEGSLAHSELMDAPRWRVQLEARSLTSEQEIVVRRVVSGSSINLESGTIHDATWSSSGDGSIRATTTSATLAFTAHGPILEIELAKGPRGGRVHLRVNEEEAELDLHALSPETEVYRFTSPGGDDDVLTVPTLIPGQFAASNVEDRHITISYRYRHQEQIPETGTRLNFYQQDTSGRWTLHDVLDLIGPQLQPIDRARFQRKNSDAVSEFRRITAQGDNRSFDQWLIDHLSAHPEESIRLGLQPVPASAALMADGDRRLRLELPEKLTGHLRIGILPGTARKRGPEYFTNAFSVPDADAAYGLVRLRLRVPKVSNTLRQPLVMAGSADTGSLVYLEVLAPNRIRFGIDAGPRGALLSSEIEIDAAQEQVVEISHGALYPLSDHPAMQGLTEAQREAVRRLVRITCNGQTLMEAYLPLPAMNPKAVRIGEAVDFPQTAPTFTGHLEPVIRAWPDSYPSTDKMRAVQDAIFGPASFEILFPQGRAGLAEPLISTGRTGAGDFLYVAFIDDRHIRFCFDHWGVRGFVGEPIEIEPGRWYRIVATMGSLYPPDGDLWFSEHELASTAKNRVEIRLDDRVVLSGESMTYESAPQLVNFGENHLGGSTTGASFSGLLRNIKRLRPGAPAVNRSQK